MRCRIANRSTAPAACRGSTLIEALTTVVTAAVVLMVVGSLLVYSVRSFTLMGNYASFNNARTALDQITREIREMATMTANRPNELKFRRAGSFTDVIFTNYVSGNTTVLSRRSGGVERVLFKGCNLLDASQFTFNPTNNQIQTSSVLSKVTVVNVSLRGYRTVLGKTNTEAISSGQILFRNRNLQ